MPATVLRKSHLIATGTSFPTPSTRPGACSRICTGRALPNSRPDRRTRLLPCPERLLVGTLSSRCHLCVSRAAITSSPVNLARSASTLADSASDPTLDVGPPVAEVSAGAEPWWALSATAPGVDRCDGDFEVVGEFLGREQRIKIVHPPSVRWDPFISMPFECQQACYLVAISAVSPGQRALWKCSKPAHTGSLRGCRRGGWRATDTLVRGLLKLC